MSDPNDSTSTEGPVFYVDEEGDDFTFYLARDEDNAVFSRLGWAKAKERLRFGAPSGALPEAGFSFSETVTIKYLDRIKASFWASLSRPEPRYRYLLRKLRTTANKKSRSAIRDEKKKGEEAKKIIQNLERGKSLRKGDKQKLQPLLALTLNQHVLNDTLKNKPWCKVLVNNLTPLEKRALESLTGEAQQRQGWNQFLIDRVFPELRREPKEGRALICLSHNGKYLSVTFRKRKEKSGYEATDYRKNEQDKRKKNLFSLAEYCRVIYDGVFDKPQSAESSQGLLVVTGSTNSAKSEIARGLIHLYLSKKKIARRHHLVTFEDPIEQWFSHDKVPGVPWAAVELSTQPGGIDYSPRQKETDVRVLKEALSDVLRQSPAVVFVGETRSKEEWEVLLDSAATGHLIVTTAHAGSLVEAMHKIFEARNVKTPEDRSEVANRLLGVIHLRKGSLVINRNKSKSELKTESTDVLFPALWRRTPRGVAGLTSDGLASLLPYRPRKSDAAGGGTGAGVLVAKGKAGSPRKSAPTDISKDEEVASCLGRRWLIEQLIDELTGDKKLKRNLEKVFGNKLEKPFGPRMPQESIKGQAYKKATEWDLQGV